MNGWILFVIWVVLTPRLACRIDDRMGIKIPDSLKYTVHVAMWELIGVGLAYIVWFEIWGATLPK